MKYRVGRRTQTKSRPSRDRGTRVESGEKRTIRGNRSSKSTSNHARLRVDGPGIRLSRPTDSQESEADRVATEISGVTGPRDIEDTSGKRRSSPTDIAGISNTIDTALPNQSFVRSAIQAPGMPLDPQTRDAMESRFGDEFGDVRVHTDSQAMDAAKVVDARAYTVGNDIVFAEDQYAPGTTQGRWLLAHELAHVVRSGSDGSPPQSGQEPLVIARVPDAADGHYTTKALAVVDVPVHVVPRDCFVWNAGHGHWMVIPGTGCAHWVAHQMNITAGTALCDSGFTIRVTDLVAGMARFPLAQAQVGDIWENPTNASHVGIVRTLDTDPATGAVTRVDVENDSSGQGAVVHTWFTQGDFYR